MKKLKVVVLMGGKSSEHEISILSGQQIVRNIDINKYDVLPVVISKDGAKWQLTSRESILKLTNPINLKGTSKEVTLSSKSVEPQSSMMTNHSVDVVFIAMHGPFGEDGIVQGILEASGVAYTGSGVMASAIGMDKPMFRKVMKAHELPIPKYVVVDKNDSTEYIFKSLGRLPYFVKPVDQGSSVGASIVRNKTELLPALKLSFSYSDLALVDEYIEGLEVTCGVLGNKNPEALPVTEIHPLKNKFFDYESKYTESGATEITPARISKGLTKKVQELSIEVYKAIGCKGFARVDFILKDDKSPIILEINTIPGLTPASLLPKSAASAGIKYSELIDKIINYAIEKN
jgi:D-alanine-D-alanine ligase